MVPSEIALIPPRQLGPALKLAYAWLYAAAEYRAAWIDVNAITFAAAFGATSRAALKWLDGLVDAGLVDVQKNHDGSVYLTPRGERRVYVWNPDHSEMVSGGEARSIVPLPQSAAAERAETVSLQMQLNNTRSEQGIRIAEDATAPIEQDSSAAPTLGSVASLLVDRHLERSDPRAAKARIAKECRDRINDPKTDYAIFQKAAHLVVNGDLEAESLDEVLASVDRAWVKEHTDPGCGFTSSAGAYFLFLLRKVYPQW